MRKADNLPPYRAVVKKSGSLNFLDPSGPARPVMGELYLYLPEFEKEVLLHTSGFYLTEVGNSFLRNSATSLQTTRRHIPKSVILQFATVKTTNVTDTSLPVYLRK